GEKDRIVAARMSAVRAEDGIRAAGNQGVGGGPVGPEERPALQVDEDLIGPRREQVADVEDGRRHLTALQRLCQEGAACRHRPAATAIAKAEEPLAQPAPHDVSPWFGDLGAARLPRRAPRTADELSIVKQGRKPAPQGRAWGAGMEKPSAPDG